MALFKRFSEEKPKATKAQLASFKAKLKFGTDPKVLYDTSREHWEEYHTMMNETKELLQKVLDAPNSEKNNAWSTLDISDYGQDCEPSPVGKHVYQRVFGKKHPDYWKPTCCLCCGEELFRARKPEDEIK